MGKQTKPMLLLTAQILIAVQLCSYVGTVSAACSASAGRLAGSVDGATAELTACDTSSSAKRKILQAAQSPSLGTTIDNAATSVTNRFNNATSGFSGLGQDSALGAAASSDNTTVGGFVNAFVNDSRTAANTAKSAVTGKNATSGATGVVVAKGNMFFVVLMVAVVSMIGLPIM